MGERRQTIRRRRTRDVNTILPLRKIAAGLIRQRQTASRRYRRRRTCSRQRARSTRRPPPVRGIREGVARKASPDMHRSERETASCVACWIVGSSVASLWVAPDGATPLFERGWSSSSAGCDFWVPLSIEEGSAVIQQGQVFRLQAGVRGGEPMWAFRYRVAGAVRRGCRWAGSAARLRRRGRSRSSWAGSCPMAVRRI